MLLLLVLSLSFCSTLVAAVDHKTGDTCTPTNETQGDCIDPNAICPSGGKCECKSGYSGPNGGTCTPDVGKIGEACQEDSTCEDIKATCDKSVCTCKDGYKPLTDEAVCVPIEQGKVNAACDNTKKCLAPNSTCVNSFCTCDSGWTGGKGDDKCDQDPNNQQGGATTTFFSSLLYFFVGMTVTVAVIAQ